MEGPTAPRLWLHYVDDTFVIWPHGQDELHRFHEHLNGQYPNIKFTIEHEENNKLAFLDVLVTRSETRGLPQTHPHRPLHPLPLTPPPENHHRGAVMYA